MLKFIENAIEGWLAFLRRQSEPESDAEYNRRLWLEGVAERRRNG